MDSQQITEAFPWNEAPRYLIRDRDGIYGLPRRTASLSWFCLQTRFRQILEGARIVDRLVAKLLQRFSGERRAPA